jgi:hypothetical protein
MSETSSVPDIQESRKVVDNPIKRDSKGRVLPGKSLNPHGRPRVRTVIEQLNAKGFDCIEEAIELFQNPKTTTYVKWDILKELLSYQYAKLRTVAVTNPDGEQASIKISWDTNDAKQQFVDHMQNVHDNVKDAILADDDNDKDC